MPFTLNRGKCRTSGTGVVTVLSSQGTIVAASASRADVQAAVNSASDGDTVLIPDGSSTWTAGISTTKQIQIKAQNITETEGGVLARNVTITHNNGSGQLFEFTTGETAHVGVSGIRFRAGQDQGNYIRVNGSGSKVALISDCSFDFYGRFGNNPDNAQIAMLCQGGVFWNCYFDGEDGDQATIANASIFIDHPRAWQTASTMGDDDDGTINCYVEDSTCKDVDAFIDGDQAARVVARNCVFDGTWSLTHGFTSGMYAGGRHFELYDNEFKSTRTDEAKNLAGRYFWLRAGTCVITDNDAAAPVRGQDYGDDVSILEIGDNTSPSGNQDMQPGWGHDGVDDIREPMYVWNNTGYNGSRVTFVDNAWENATTVATVPGQADGELFVDLGAKPGWSKYSYPHPLRS